MHQAAFYGPAIAAIITPSLGAPALLRAQILTSPFHRRIMAANNDQQRIRRRRRPVAFLRGSGSSESFSQHQDDPIENDDAFNPFLHTAESESGGNGHALDPPLSSVHQRIVRIVGDPATTDPSRFPTRDDMQIPSTYPLHVDLGGEGYFTSHGVTCGFRNAINVNARRTNSQMLLRGSSTGTGGRPIPLLVRVVDWKYDPPIPLADGVVDYVTMQSAPLTGRNVDEICRILAPGGCVGLWIDLDGPVDDAKGGVDNNGGGATKCTNLDMAHRLAERLDSTLEYCRSSTTNKENHEKGRRNHIWECTDEFDGRYPFPKLCIFNGRSIYRMDTFSRLHVS